jgi:hypothetical protein
VVVDGWLRKSGRRWFNAESLVLRENGFADDPMRLGQHQALARPSTFSTFHPLSSYQSILIHPFYLLLNVNDKLESFF